MTPPQPDKPKPAHFHRLLLDGEEPNLYGEILHAHDGGDAAHEHVPTVSAGYVKIDRPLRVKRPRKSDTGA